MTPRSLFARVTLIIVVGLAVAQLLTFAAIRYERGMALRELMMTGIERDIASSIAIMDRLPAAEREGWLDRLERRNYRFMLGGGVAGPQPASEQSQAFAAAIVNALHPFEVVKVAQATGDDVRIEVRLGDGSPVVVDARRVGMPMSSWVVWVLLLQLAVLGICAWLAVRLVTRPLARLAAAADELGPDLKGQMLREEGPTEVAHAARAFNAMQRRIAGYMAERLEILAAISHDLQTPITRMRLRTEMMDDEKDQLKFRQDLDAMNALVREGVTYARTLHGATEPPCRVDADALLESMVADYQDSGRQVRLEGRIGGPIVTRPNALRRIVMNLVDNALNFASDVRMQVRVEADRLVIAVIDNGPGIPPDQLEAVLKPFYRLEGSRNRSTGGTGLGLAIAHQLAIAMGAELSLHNRDEGGLEARVAMPLQRDTAS
ncbi:MULTISPECIES: ATP-binding protein [unclassified Variovorax]|uniref:ATP-binding protein n=1 Tax=unclassified Variovorax TaxID=663243 RepID=UPI00076C25A6|nr:MULTISPECIES: ATP-binding protein [unclassified Variovorax]KWT91911.1 Signal transduction histidine kinase [Variovorax sp. WDL1]PNG46898.1 Osmolarity sensor protein EnvZ [Variovorax sp. B2]PNG48451.1 Osmolarity sensor protein EnvZ [Variovorax sp. B4]VTV14726.1 Osmolarity sensor protein EnvZ [Variovorax sp. WDL1]